MRIVIVGAGKAGAYLAEKLRADSEVTLIEQHADKVDRIKMRMPDVRVVHGDGCEPSLLERAGVADADFVAAATGDDEDNLVISHLVKTIGGSAVVFARVNHPANEWLFTPAWGVDVAVGAAATMYTLVEQERAGRA